MLRTLYLLLFVVFAPSTVIAAKGIVVKDIKYGRGNYSGYLAHPTTAKKLPGIILIHEWWGLNENIKHNAKKFAKEGYIALAVDLYGGKVTSDPKKAGELAGKVRQNQKGAFKNLNAAIDYLKNLGAKVNASRLASIGWCFGGGWSYEVAKNDLGVKASVIYYGRFNPKDDLKKMRALILGNFAEKDRVIRVDNVREFQARLKKTKKPHEIYIYPNTHHGFANETNSIYDQKAASLAWKRTLAFLKKHL